jgi:hypothetical protein
VRTRYGQIILVDWVGNAIVVDKEGRTVLTVDGSITKHSPNIIDLIEVRDYVNGELVASVDEESVEIGEGWHVKSKDIKSIVTHQQFNSIKYEVI